MISKQFSRLISLRKLSSTASSSRGISPVKPILSHLKFKNMAMFCSSSSDQVKTETDQQKFYIRKDGKRLSGSEFLEIVKSVCTKDRDENFVVPKSAFDVLLSEYDELMVEGIDLKDRYQRSLAETENVRRRGIKQTEEAKIFAIQGFCKDLLEVADILDLAVHSVKPDELKSASKPLQDLHSGIVMTKTVLLKTFSKHGLVVVNPLGEKFDPNLHEAVFQIAPEQSDVRPGHVAHVAKVGYCLQERPVRPAQVGVVMNN